jgi:hypothetical protein
MRSTHHSWMSRWRVSFSLQLRTLRGVHEARIGSPAWNNNVLTTGGMDGKIVNNDVRIRNQVVQTYEGHTQEVCELKWFGSGATVGEWRQRQPSPHLGCVDGVLCPISWPQPVAAQARGPHARYEGSSLVPVPKQPVVAIAASSSGTRIPVLS